jgi:hypothetical protein
MKLALCIRGHVRDGLFTRGLTQYIDQLTAKGHDVQLYLHTWKESEAKSSYRVLDRKYVFKVSDELLQNYFKDYNVQKIIIDDDSKIKIYGKKTGHVSASTCPLLAWKRMWVGQHKILSHVYECQEKYDVVINTRFDMFTTPVCYTPPSTLNSLILQKDNIAFKYPTYTKNVVGVDNFYIGKIETMYKLVSDFYVSLDDILKTYSTIKHQEEIVYRYAVDNNLL